MSVSVSVSVSGQSVVCLPLCLSLKSLGRLDLLRPIFLLAPHGPRCPPPTWSPYVPCPILIYEVLRQRATTIRLPPLFHHDSFLFSPFLLTPHLPTTRSIDHTSATRRSVVCRPSRGPFLSLKPLCSLEFLFGELPFWVPVLRQISQLMPLSLS